MSRVKALAEALEGSDVSELDLTENGLRILIRRQAGTMLIAPTPTSAPRARMNGGPRKAALPKRAESSAPAAEPGIAIVAPLTGVFYLSPSPSSDPFVAVGQPLQAGQVACIVEAMKVFNEIKSEVSGTVVAIVAQNGQLVQKGEALIRVQAS
ncbi:MAG: acetyl-CoA carboxylase biotin carboxyl carrier protein [Chloroflexota bacterium]|nr:acetyl-CoA carboxylase biotin carboxyl carrier protein [Chloroflexota bacterium]